MDEYTLVHLAVINTHRDALQRLLTLGRSVCDVNIQTGFRGWTALYISAREGDVHCATLLLEHGANYNLRANDSQSPFFIAHAQKHRELVELLEKSGADTTSWMGLSPKTPFQGGKRMLRPSRSSTSKGGPTSS